MSLGIAIVSREYPPFFGGGIGTYARHIAPALAAAGCRVHVITQSYDETHPSLAAEGGVTVHRLPLLGSGAKWTAAVQRFAVLVARRVAELGDAGEIDIVEFAECEGAGALFAAVRRMAQSGATGAPPGVPAVVQLHTPSEVLYVLRSLPNKGLTPAFAAYVLAERTSIRAADAVCAPSAFIADWAAEFYGLGSRPTVIPYAIEGLPPPTEDSPQRRVLFVGRIEPRKGVEPLVRAWARIVAKCPGWTLRLAGADTSTSPRGTSMRGHLHELMTPGLRGGTVQFMGPLPPAMLAGEYASAALCVVPSLWENYPNTCIEAMSHGRAVVASDEGGMREMLGAPEVGAGLTFASGDVDDLAGKLLAMIGEGTDRLAARGLIGRTRIARICDKDAVARRRIDFYRSVIESRRGASRRHDPAPMLDLWRSLQRAARGQADPLELPRLRPGISRWIATEAVA